MIEPTPWPGLGLTARIVLPFGFGFLLADATRVINAVAGPGLAAFAWLIACRRAPR